MGKNYTMHDSSDSVSDECMHYMAGQWPHGHPVKESSYHDHDPYRR